MNEAVVERIEIKIAFLERANLELSDVVYRQQQEIAALRAQLELLLGRMESLTQGSEATATAGPG
jgi:uncharacterized coiled-coil protein SlyX